MMNQKNRANAHGSGLAWLRRVTAFVCTFAMLFSSCGPVLSGDTALAQYSEDYRVTSDPIYPTTPLPSLLPSATPEEDPEATPIPDEYWDGQGGALTASGDGWTATLTYRTEAKIPDGAVLTLTELKGADLYNAMKSAAALLKNDADEVWRRELSNEDNHFFTASITDPDGNTVQPQAAVALTWRNTNHDSEQTYFSFGDEASRIVESADGTMHFKPYLGESFGYGATDNTQIGTVTQVHEGSDYMVTASYGPEAGFPAGTELKVREIMPGTAEYATYSGMTDEALGEDWSEITLERYFDIAFVKDGKELEPQADIDVQISFSEKIELTEEHDVAAVHIENNEATVIETETESNEAAKYDSEAIDTVAFSSDSFSVYGVVQKKRIITKVLEAGGNTYEIELSYTQEAEIPENAQLVVEEIPEGSDLWEAYRIQTAAALKADDVRLPGLYDISIVDEAGEKIKPAIPVNIAIKLLNDDTTEDIQIVHFKEEIPQELVDEAAQQAEQAAQEQPSQPEPQQPEEQKEELKAGQSEAQPEEKSEEPTEVQAQPAEPSQTIESETITATVEGDTVTFEAETFSVYAFAYTVDFSYKDEEGNYIVWSYPGRGSYPVADILSLLGIDEKVVDVTLALIQGEDHEGALYLSKDTNGEWLLNSDVAFTDIYRLEIVTETKNVSVTVSDASSGYVMSQDPNKGYLKVSTKEFKNGAVVHDTDLVKNGDTSTGTTNRYRIYAVAENGYGFWKWRVNTGNEEHDALSAKLQTDQIAPGDLELAALQRGEIVKACFYGAFRGVDVDDSSRSFGVVKVNSEQKNDVIWYNDSWKNSNGNNTYSFEAIPNSGYDFVRWDYYRQNDDTPSDRSRWTLKNSIYTQIISADTFAVERNEGWVLRAVFAKVEPFTFSIQTNGSGNLSSKYYYTGSGDRVNTPGTVLNNVKGSFVDPETADATRFSYGFVVNDGEGKKIAFWTYTDPITNELVKVDEITFRTVIPYNNLTYTAYLVDSNVNLFLYMSEDSSKGSVSKDRGLSTESGATATPASGMIFLGWYDLEGNLVSEEQTFNPATASKSNILVARFGKEQTVRINVSVNASDYGDVQKNGQSRVGDQYTNSHGRLYETVIAVPYEGYEFVYWTLNDNILEYDSATMGPRTDPAVFFSEGDRLQAVFKPVTVIDESGSAHSTYSISSTKKQELDQWLNSLQNNVSASGTKTAHAYDEANRIFEIDFTAESTLMDLAADLDIAFILDVSNSMLFPSKLEKIHDSMVLTQDSLNKTYPEGGTYYIISNPTGTSTVYKIFKEDGIWYYVDASHTNNEGMQRVEWNARYAQPTKDVPFAFPIYRAVGSSVRKDFLNSSLNSAMTSLRGILANIQNAGGTTKKIKVAYNTFASSVTGTHDFEVLNQSLSVSAGNTSGGTRQDLALDDARRNFNWTGNTRYAILITDGAPVVGKGVTDVNSETVFTAVENAASALKTEKNVKLITIGLSTQDVTRGSHLLQTIASDNMFFEAESGNDLQYILLDILQRIMQQHTVDGIVSDTLDSAFYPVTADGTPIEPGFYNNDGTWKSNQRADGAPCYQWSVNSGVWTITWYNQHFTHYENNEWVNWSDKIYVKAKEDFLGGNKINTNSNAYVWPTHWQDGAGWKEFTNNQFVTLPVPEVNVKELSFTQDSSDETVFVRQSVTPKDSINALFDLINVNELVSATAVDHRRTSDSKKVTEAGFTAETYTLKSLIGELQDPQWDTLIAGDTVTIPYVAYGHNAGNITLKLIPWSVEGEPHDVTEHATVVVATPAETYTLAVNYVPSATGAGTLYPATTEGRTAGSLTGTINSNNVHTINVIDGPTTQVDVTKTWDNDTAYADTVNVTLYRKAVVSDEPQNPVNTGDNPGQNTGDQPGDNPTGGNENTTATVHLTVNLTDADSKATAVTARVNGNDVSLTKNGNQYTGDVVLNKGGEYDITFDGTASDSYTVSINDGHITVGQNDEQSFSTTGTVAAPSVTSQTRNITLTINWTGDGAWSYTDNQGATSNTIWGQVGSRSWNDWIGFNSLFSNGNNSATAFQVSTSERLLQLGNIDYDQYDYTLNPAHHFWKNGSQFIVDIPAGNEDISYVLTISSKNNGSNTVTNPDGTMTVNLIARDIVPIRPADSWAVRLDSAGELHTNGYKQHYPLGGPLTSDGQNIRISSITVTDNDGSVCSYEFAFGCDNVLNPIAASDNSHVHIDGNKITIDAVAEVINIYFYSGNVGGSLIKPLRFRAAGGVSTDPATRGTTSPVVNYPANQPDISEMELVETIPLTAASETPWYYQWTDMPATDTEGNLYQYYVVETVPAGTSQVDYTRTVDDDGTHVTIKNTPSEPEDGSLQVSKSVTGNAGDTNKDFNFTVTLSDTSINGTKGDMSFTDGVANFTLKSGENKTATGLPAGITYTVVEAEANADGYTTTTTGNATDTIPAGGIATVGFINDKTDIYGHLTVNKIVVGSMDPELLPKTYSLGVVDEEGNYYGSNGENKGQTPFYQTVTGSIPGGTAGGISGNTSAVWSNLTPGTYTIVEADAQVTGFELTTTGTGPIEIQAGNNPNVDVTNTYRYPVGITAKKAWKSGEPGLIKAVRFELKRQAGAMGNVQKVESDAEGFVNPVTVSAENNWTASWSNQDLYSDDKGGQYSYFVVETGIYCGTKAVNEITEDDWVDAKIAYVSGGNVSFDENGAAEVTITNYETTDVPVTKTWEAYNSSEYKWTVDFQLQQKEVLVSGTAAGDAITDWQDVSGKTLTISKNQVGSSKFENLELFRVHPNGSVYRVLYHAKETAYIVQKVSDDSVVARWSETNATLKVSDNGIDYEPYYAQNAGEDMSITDLLARYSIVVENKPKVSYDGMLVIHKEWLDIYPDDLPYYPAVWVNLYKVPALTGDQTGYGMDAYNKAEFVATKKLTYADNEWTWVINGDDLDEGYNYFVIEQPADGVQTREYNLKDNAKTYASKIIKTDPPYNTNEKMAITVDAYKARDTYGKGDWRSAKWEESIGAYAGNTGEILIQNKAPSAYMQLDLKKKFLEYRQDSNNVWSLWTTTQETDVMNDMIIEIQIMRRMVDENGTDSTSDDVLLNNGKWEAYGKTIFVGYDGSGKEYIDKNGNLFEVVNAGGNWHFRVICDNQNQGLPRRGYISINNEIKQVRYQYILKEVQVYDGSLHKIGDGWAAWLPWLWDGITDTPTQREVNVPATAQDQDRLFNTPGGSLYIEKEWNIDAADVNVKEIYLKVYRRAKGSTETGEDYLDTICQYMSSGLGDNYLEGNPTGTLDERKKRLVLSDSNQWKAVLHKVPFAGIKGNFSEFEYYIVETGYLDSNDVEHDATDTQHAFTPKYYVTTGGSEWTEVQEGHGLVMQWTGTNKLKVSNTLDVVSIPVKKNWTGGTPDSNAAVDVELVKVDNGTEVHFNPTRTLTLKPDTNWQGVFGGLDKKDSAGNDITYRVKETRVVLNGMEYTGDNLTTVFGNSESNVKEFTFGSTSIGSSTLAVFNNPIETKSITATKQWDGSENWPAGMSVTFELTATAGTTTWEVPADTSGKFGANTPSATVSSTDTNKVVSWTNLPKWTFTGNNVATEIKYSVAEASVMYNGEDVTAAYDIAYSNDEDGNWIINNTPRTGSLKIEKTVTLNGGGTLEEEKTFYFTVTDGEGNYYYKNNGDLATTKTQPTETGSAGVVSVASGSAGITLTGLPIGNYTVSEVFVNDVTINGYKHTSTTLNGTGGYTANVTVVKDDDTNNVDETVYVRARNDYERETGNLTIVKTVTLAGGGTLAAPTNYYFTVSDSEGNYYYKNGNELATTTTVPAAETSAGIITVASGSEGVTLTGLPTGSYTVKEVFINKVEIVGYAYDGTTLNGEVRADDEITVNVADNATVTVNANNSYKRGKLQVSKSFSGVTALPDTFAIKVTGLGEEIRLTTSGSQPDGVTLAADSTGETPVYTWTLENLPIGTNVKFEEDGYGVAGYVWTGTVSVNGAQPKEGNSDSVLVVAEPTINSVAFNNTYVAGTELPATGGPGTLAYTLGGLALILLAGALWMVRKRRKA